jgi:glutathione S-transferase kappa 1
MPKLNKISFFYDCLSPFSYLAFHALKRYQPVWGIDIELKPFLLGGVMAATKNLPPAVRPWAAATAKVSAQDMVRNKQYFNLPHMKPMPNNFFGPQGPADKTGLSSISNTYMRCLAAVSMKYPDCLMGVTTGVFEMIWGDDRDGNNNVVVTPTRLARICEGAGLSTEEADLILQKVNADTVKSILRKNVEDAVALGAYGSPFIVAGDQVYFGSDRLEVMAFTHDLAWVGPDPGRPSVAKL